MSPIEDSIVDYHQQDNDFSCGAACAEMILVSPPAGPRLGGSLADQKFQQTKKAASDPAGLYDDVVAETAPLPFSVVGWFNTGAKPGTHPDILADILNTHSTDVGIKFQVFASTDREEIACRVAYTLHQYGIAPGILMWGGQHWSAVTGCNYVVTADRTKIDILDFLVQDPFPPMPKPITPHAEGDGCGDGALATIVAGAKQGLHYRGFASAHIPYKPWCCEYMADPIPATPPTTAIPSSPIGALNGMYVAVCAVNADGNDASGPPPAPFSISTSALPCATAPKAVGHSLDDDLAKANPVSITKAITVAINNLTDLTSAKYSLATRSPWDKVIGSLANLEMPSMVALMKKTGVIARFISKAPDFFLVPVVLKSGMPAVVRIALDPDKIVPALNNPADLHGFDYVDAVAVPSNAMTCIAITDMTQLGIRRVFVVLPPDGLNNVVAPVALQYDFSQGSTDARLVWDACRQSFSPYVPFYKLRVQSALLPGVDHIYLRADFQVVGGTVSMEAFVAPDTSLGGI